MSWVNDVALCEDVSRLIERIRKEERKAITDWLETRQWPDQFTRDAYIKAYADAIRNGEHVAAGEETGDPRDAMKACGAYKPNTTELPEVRIRRLRDGDEEGREKERKAIAEWLETIQSDYRFHNRRLATRIRNGEHVKEGQSDSQGT